MKQQSHEIWFFVVVPNDPVFKVTTFEKNLTGHHETYRCLECNFSANRLENKQHYPDETGLCSSASV